MNKNKFLLIAVTLLLFVFVLYAVINAGKQNTNLVSPNPTATPQVSSVPSPTTADLTPEKAAAGFYTDYENCMKNPPEAATGQGGIYCQSHNSFISATFSANLEHGGIAKAGADPVVCAQNFPTSFGIGKMTISGNEAAGEITESFGDQVKVKTNLSLINESGTWKVNNITCPKP